MTAENSQSTSLKQKAAHEFKEMTIVTVYLAFFFCALACGWRIVVLPIFP
jgi:hypothetical protein